MSFTGLIDSEAALSGIRLCSSRSPNYIHRYILRANFLCNRHFNRQDMHLYQTIVYFDTSSRGGTGYVLCGGIPLTFAGIN